MQKVCSICYIQKSIDDFYKFKSEKSYRSYCKECGREKCRQYKLKNKEKISDYNKKYKAENKDKISDYNKEYNIENRTKIQDRQNIQHRERRKVDINYRIRTNLSNRILKVLNTKKTETTNKLLGCSQEELKFWLEYQFSKDMTWENYGTLWHIDHVIPCSIFDLSLIEQQNICFNWSNLRPLYAIDNLVKNNVLFWSDLLCHHIKLSYFSKSFLKDINKFNLFLKNLKYTKSTTAKGRWRLGNQDGIVTIA